VTERVDFYVLKNADARARHVFACRLTEKAYLKQHSVLLLAADEEQARELDELLWTFDDGSFVPHQWLRGDAVPDPLTPVSIALDAQAPVSAALVLNLAGRDPDALMRFARIAEILDEDPERRRLGRERFKTYRERQIPLETHQLNE
jgi:DNA polymerase-3 subunit chi